MINFQSDASPVWKEALLFLKKNLQGIPIISFPLFAEL